jgi:parvulin-like peptidyl-prolyl isomerase
MTDEKLREAKMSEKLNLSLPERGRPTARTPKATLGLLLAILFLNLSVLGALKHVERAATTHEVASPGTLSADAQKALALKLQKQGLNESAAEAWQAYLASANLDNAETANIVYQIGKLHQEANQTERALEAYYRAEALGVSDAVAQEIGRRAQQCLEELGKFAALRYELAERVGVNQDDAALGETVLAEIGGQKITQAELDRRIESEIDNQLRQYAAFMPEDAQKQQKERMLKEFSSREGRMQLLSQVVAEEVLYRRARESKVAEQDDVRALLRSTERKLLAQQVMEAALQDKINITQGDVENYYAAHQQEYLQPERVRVAHILLPDDAGARTVLERLAAGEDFDMLAKELSGDAATKDKGGRVESWVTPGKGLPALGLSADVLAPIFGKASGSWLNEPLASESGRHVLRVLEQEAARQRSLEEVAQEVGQALRRQKEQEVQAQLMKELQDEYNVVIHAAQFGGDEAEATTPTP